MVFAFTVVSVKLVTLGGSTPTRDQIPVVVSCRQRANAVALLLLLVQPSLTWVSDTEVVTSDWIEALLEHAQRPDVAAVGARLVLPGGRAQHEGIILRPHEGVLGLNVDHHGYFGLGRCVHNCSAVTGACMMTRLDLFRELGGFEEKMRVAFNDIDYCLRAREKGYVIVYTPYATLVHAEGGTRGRNGRTHPTEDAEVFRRRWAEYSDPYYSPNFEIMPPYGRLRASHDLSASPGTR